MSFNFMGAGPLIVPTEANSLNLSDRFDWTLTQDLIVGDLNLQSQTINTNGYRIYCRNLTMYNSVIKNDGLNAAHFSGGSGGPGVVVHSGSCRGYGTLGGGGIGGDGIYNSRTNPTSFIVGSLGGWGGDGADGVGGAGTAGGSTGFSRSDADIQIGVNPFQPSVFQYGYLTAIGAGTVNPETIYYNTISTTQIPKVITTPVTGGGGGGPGGLDASTTSHYGGGGGGGGGVVLICCSGNISMYSNSTITANGGNGVNGINSDAGAGGGGGGGVVIISCNSLSLPIDEDGGIFAQHGASGSVRSGYTGSDGHILIMTPNRTGLWTGSLQYTDSPVFPNMINDTYLESMKQIVS